MFENVISGSDNSILFDNSVRHIVQSAMAGLNGTVFAYGQSNSGKTHSIIGTPTNPGMIPRAVNEVFDIIRHDSKSGREYLLRVAYMEIYNENIRDLLAPETTNLRIHEDKRRGIYVSPLKEEIVTTPSQVMKILQRGESNRKTGATDFNEHSSRSHAIFQFIIESRAPTIQSRSGTPLLGGMTGSTARRVTMASSEHLEGIRISTLSLIDLAGSEKATSSLDRRKEGAYINKSLLTLGTVVSKLSEAQPGHIPYRDSKLTRILQSSLSGNARVAVICTISPSALSYEESINTLKFATRVKRVTTNAKVMRIEDERALLQKYRIEILELRSKL
ncbi:kinesin-domain-containing protein, partial [Ramicandelaber brevisporus]